MIYDPHDWKVIDSAPFGVDIQLAVIEGFEIVALVFPCRREQGIWVASATGLRVYVFPTHWRDWPNPNARLGRRSVAWIWLGA